jgi:hypothetical protein
VSNSLFKSILCFCLMDVWFCFLFIGDDKHYFYEVFSMLGKGPWCLSWLNSKHNFLILSNEKF